VEQKGTRLLRAVTRFLNTAPDVEPVAALMRTRVKSILNLSVIEEEYAWPWSCKYKATATRLHEKLENDVFNWTVLLLSALTNALGEITGKPGPEASQTVRTWIDDWLLRNVIRETFEQLPSSHAAAGYGTTLIRLLVGQCDWINIASSIAGKPRTAMAAWLADQAIRDFLRINTFDQIEWFNQEAMQTWLDWMTILGAVNILCDETIAEEDKPKKLVQMHDWILRIEKAADQAEFQVGKLVENLKGR
jgi:hypothetical protein